MGLLDIFKKKKSVNEFPHPDNRGWVTVGGTTAYDAFKANDYENAYPSISKIANRFMMISPVARDVDNEPVKNAPALEALYRPNKDMSSVDFREALAVMYLVHPEVHILVWSKRNAVGGKPVPGGVIKREEDIAGYTFLEKAVKTTIDNRTVFIDKDGNQYDDTQVISLRGAFPYNLSRGFSATEAAKRWTTIDDYIADYQRGFFKNGARPSGLYLITAASQKDYEDTVATIKNKHEGAGNNNKVMFAPRPMGQDGKEAAPKVEFIPISIDNNALDLKNIFEQVNQKIDSAFGVPASIRGVGENNNFATAQQDNRNFVENVVDPLAKKIWTRFTHELNRICGGLGYAITYELDLPAVSEDEKVQAETKAINLQSIITAVNAGYPEENVINALELPESYKDLIGKRVVIEDENLEVDTEDDTEDTPDPEDLTVGRRSVKQISSRDYPDLYSDIDIDTDDLGCIMLDLEPMDVIKYVEGKEDELFENPKYGQGSVPAETVPHVTLLYGLLENGNKWSDKVDSLLEDWKIDSVKIDHIDYFDTPDSYAVVAHLEKTPALVDGHERLTLLPHISTFSEYLPHMTLAYVDKSANVDEWVKILGKQYNGKTVKAKGINYGDPEDDDTKSAGGSEHTDPKVKKISDEDRETAETRLEDVVRRHMRTQIDNAINTTKAVGDASVDEIEAFVDDMLVVIYATMIAQGAIEYAAGAAMLTNAGISTDKLTHFVLSDTARDAYRTYLMDVGHSYASETATSIRTVLDYANTQGYTRVQTEQALRDIMNTDEFRVKRIGRTEINRSQGIAGLEGMKQIGDEAGVVLQKVWSASHADPCDICKDLDGTAVGIESDFIPLGETIPTTDRINDFSPIDTATAHPNCRCVTTYKVVSVNKLAKAEDTSNDIYDPSTGRYLGRKLQNGYIALRGYQSDKDTIVKL